MKNKKEASIVIIMLILVVLSFLMFDFSFTWIKEVPFQSVLILILTILYTILLSRILKDLNQKKNEIFFDRLIFMIISFLLILLSSTCYDGTRSNSFLNNVVFPIVIFSGGVSSLILLLKRHTKNKDQSGDGSLIDKNNTDDSSE